MQKEVFQTYLDKGFNRIPIVREVLADMDTPLSIYLKLANQPYSYLFESMQGGEKWGRYSIIGLPCQKVIKVYGADIHVEESGETVKTVRSDDPLSWIEKFFEDVRAPGIEGLPRFNGGLVGYFGYDTVRYIEPRLAKCPNPDQLQTPDILLMLSDEVVVFDNLNSKLYLIVHAADEAEFDAAEERLDALQVQISQSASIPQSAANSSDITEQDFQSGFTEAAFKQAVEKARQYIVDGDIMQVVLSQRLSIPFEVPPLNLYRALRVLNPSPYMYCMHLNDFHVVGSSPEILTHIENGEVTVRPIAGTRPRGGTEVEDKQYEQDLLQDPKELAEHLMLIDLGRNDIGRVSEVGSVRLTDKMIIERYSHVMHIASNVVGKLKRNLGAFDALRATFPAGTLSGASKVRAMEIIDELEPVKRGIYGGAVGYIGWSGNMDLAIAIRTAVIKDKTLHVQAGAGIVYDSIPQSEWDETMNKGRAIFRAVALAAEGLDSKITQAAKRGSSCC